MTKISRYKVDKKLGRRLKKEFWQFLGAAKGKDVEEFFGEFLTPTEIIMFSKRLAILKRLEVGQSYSQIRMDLKVTNATVAKMSNILHRASRVFRSVLVRSSKK